MGEKVVLCFVLVFPQSGIESRLEVGGRGRGGGSRWGNLGHRSWSDSSSEASEVEPTSAQRLGPPRLWSRSGRGRSSIGASIFATTGGSPMAPTPASRSGPSPTNKDTLHSDVPRIPDTKPRFASVMAGGLDGVCCGVRVFSVTSLRSNRGAL
jgi:hypothetical protein